MYAPPNIIVAAEMSSVQTTSTIEAKLEKLSQSIENKYRDTDILCAKYNALLDDTAKLKESRPHPLILPELNKRLADLEYSLGTSNNNVLHDGL